MNRNLKIIYGDVTPEAKENFYTTATESKFGTEYQKHFRKYNYNNMNYGNPCELYSLPLDGSTTCATEAEMYNGIAYLSDQLSNSAGGFDQPIKLTMLSPHNFTAKGFTFTFDQYNDIYATNIDIEWIRTNENVEETISKKTFRPDSYMFFCENDVSLFNKVIITFHSLNMPYNRLRLSSIDFGYGTVFESDQLKNVYIDKAINLISSEVQINNAVVDLMMRRNQKNNYSFSSKQNMRIMLDEQIHFEGFIEDTQRNDEFWYTITLEDYLGIMEDKLYYGDVYTDVSGKQLIEDVFATCNVPYEIDTQFEDKQLSGTIGIVSCREALRQLAFACGLVIMPLTDRIALQVINFDNTKISQVIRKDRILQGVSITEDKVITRVNLTSYKYIPPIIGVQYGTKVQVDNNFTLLQTNLQYTNDELITMYSEEPLYNICGGLYGPYYIGEQHTYEGTYLDIRNVSEYIDVIGTTAYSITAKIKQSGIDVGGWQYGVAKEITSRDNDRLLYNSVENVRTLENATLISESNVQDILNRCYDYYMHNITVTARVADRKRDKNRQKIKWGQKKWGAFKWGQIDNSTISRDSEVNLGDKIKLETEYQGERIGTVVGINYNLNSNIIVKEVTII